MSVPISQQEGFHHLEAMFPLVVRRVKFPQTITASSFAERVIRFKVINRSLQVLSKINFLNWSDRFSGLITEWTNH